MVQAGSSVEHLPAFVSGQALPKVTHSVSARRFVIFSDAAKEGTDNPGLGEWVVGYCWSIPLASDHLILDNPILEAIAAVVNGVFTHKVIGGTDHLPEDLCFEAHVDAQATAQVLIKGRARFPMMQLVHSIALQIPEFIEILLFLLVKHIFGLGNVASDAASRGYTRVLRLVAEALSVRLIRMDPPEVAWHLLSSCVKASKLKHEHAWGIRGERVGETDKPGPAFTPMQSRFHMAESALPRKRSTESSADGQSKK